MKSELFRAGFVVALFVVAAACGSSEPAPSGEVVVEDAGKPKRDASSTSSEDSGLPPPVDDGGVEADAARPWPTCDAPPASATKRTIAAIWQAEPATESETWVSGAYVTAVSGAACEAGKACQFFVQDDPSYASLGLAAKHAIKVFASAPVASHFTGVRVGDRVDLLGWAWRYDLDAQHELLIEVNAKLPGCAKTTSSGNALTPLEGLTLSDLTIDEYENTHGPLFVKVAGVSGKVGATLTETFGLWTTGVPFDAGASTDIVSLSPFFLTNATFTGLYPVAVTDFTSVTGVFGLFVPAGGPKYLEIYVRTAEDVVVAPN